VRAVPARALWADVPDSDDSAVPEDAVVDDEVPEEDAVDDEAEVPDDAAGDAEVPEDAVDEGCARSARTPKCYRGALGR